MRVYARDQAARPGGLDQAAEPDHFHPRDREVERLGLTFEGGQRRFEPGKPAVITIGGKPTNGNVHADAVQLLPQP